MISSELLWSKVYKEHMTRAWYDFLYPILGNPRMVQVFEFLEGMARRKIKLTPDQKNIFAPFDFFGPKDLKMVILGTGPTSHNTEHNNGLSFSYRKNTDTPLWIDQFIGCIQVCEKNELNASQYYQKYFDLDRLKYEKKNLMEEYNSALDENDPESLQLADRYFTLDAYLEEEREAIDMSWYREGLSSMYPVDCLANQGVLMLNLAPTATVGKGSDNFKHINAWNWFTSNVIERISSDLKDVIFFGYEDLTRGMIEGIVDENKHLVLTPEELPGYTLTEKVNDYIAEKKDIKKIIDFSILINDG